MSEDTIGKQESPKLSRRDFLKVAGIAMGAGTLVANGVVAKDRIFFAKEHSIDMDNYLSKIKVEGRDEWTINFTALRLFFPDVVKESEHGGFVLRNEKETPVVLDFSNASGKEIRLFPNQAEVSKSNMSWDKANQESGFGVASGGLILEGDFRVKGNIAKHPVFVGDVLDRVICFKGSGKEECSVEDITFRGLNAFKQDQNGREDCPDPAFIAGDNINLEVQGINIDYVPVKPDWANEENSQLAKGIILHNTRNQEPLQLLVAHSMIRGLQWDGITSNGLVDVRVDNSRLIQDRSYKQSRGVGIASTFNSPKGKITINRSLVDYCKGTSIWVNEQTDLPREGNNLEIFDSTINNASWAVSIDAEQKTRIKNLEVAPDYDGGPQEGSVYWPLDLNWKGNKFDLSFDGLKFKLYPKMGDAVKLAFFANWEGFSDFQGMAPADFFTEHFGSWGDLSARVKFPEGETEIKVTKDQFLDFLQNIQVGEQSMNPSGMMLWFDMKERQFVVLFATELDSESGTMYFSDPFYISTESKRNNENASVRISRTVSRIGPEVKVA